MPNDKLILEINVPLSQPVPSFKNHKHSSRRSGFVYCDPKIKARMSEIENGILSALCSLCRTTSGATDLECRKQLRTALSGLSDDSLNQIPTSSFDTEYGLPAVKIIITKL